MGQIRWITITALAAAALLATGCGLSELQRANTRRGPGPAGPPCVYEPSCPATPTPSPGPDTGLPRSVTGEIQGLPGYRPTTV